MESPIAAPAAAKATLVTTQPQAGNMKMTSMAPQNESVQEPGNHHHRHGPAQRLRGGGAGKNAARAVANALRILFVRCVTPPLDTPDSTNLSWQAAHARCAAKCARSILPYDT
ncbi:hypothetical protein J132_01005 [Termitomyces sp. J132]|nr:hypothetical protein J132_01005 [Termitomyces sp. J132]